VLKVIHKNRKLQLFLGFIIGIIFGFLLQKGGVTSYDVIIGQLLLKDFTVVKIILSAILVGMIGIYVLKSLKLIRLHPKAGSFGSTIPGGLIFGVGFALLGYCPGTVAGAAGQGWLDALFGGVPGIIFGAGLFAAFYPGLKKNILDKGEFGDVTFPQLLKINPWAVTAPVAVFIIGLLFLIERSGL
jgi:uncharacterized protein